ncbi:hypothetical protein AKG11_24580 [Shinella sp. SUS2]|nr:hypothetical protein AKG11_24580 [Shinella sp. SUS2]KOC73175.1 hypothetical protein AKG10_23750 [Shinella sp. GWS1]
MSHSDLPILQSNARSHQLARHGWPETISLDGPSSGVALLFGAPQTSRIVPIYLANATGSLLIDVFVSDAGFINFDETHEDTRPHVRALETIESGTGSFLDAYLLDLAGDFLVSYSVIATTEQGVRYYGSAPISRPPHDGWIAIEDWAPIRA